MNKFSLHPRLLAVSVILLCAYASLDDAHADAPNFRWAQQGGGTANDYGNRVAIDSSGNTFVVGVNYSPNASLGSVAFTNDGSFLAKYGVSGNLLWAKHFTKLNFQGVGVDAAGNCYMAGDFAGVINLGEVAFTNNSASNFNDFFIAKYADNGDLVWAVKASEYASTNEVGETCMAVDTAGNCFVSGVYSSTAYIGTNVLVTSRSSIFVAKCDPAGNWLWAKDPLGLPPVDYPVWPVAIALGSQADYYVAGRFPGAMVTFGSFTLTNAGNQDAFLIKCDSAGTVLWAKQAGGSDYDGAVDLAVDPLGNAYLLGGANGNAFPTLPPITIDGFVVTNAGFFLTKYDAGGTTVWARNAADFGPGYIGSPAGAFGVAVDAVGNSYVAGRFENPVKFDNIALTNQQGQYPSSFIVKYDASGQALWAKQFGGGNDHLSSNFNDSKLGIAVDDVGNCAVTGYFSLTNVPFDTFTLSTSGNNDFFAARIDADPPRLNILPAGNVVVISWLTNQPAFQLESTTILPPGTNWSPVTNSAGVIGNQNFVTNEVSGDARFYRLRKL
jgi:hypothetical protein